MSSFSAELSAASPPASDQYQALLQGMEQAFCRLEIVFDDEGTAIDCLFLEANPAFERQTNLGNPAGKTMREMNATYAGPWVRSYSAVVRGGQPVHFEQESTAGGHWYDIFAAPVGPPGSSQIAVLFSDISERKRRERSLRCLADITSDLNGLPEVAALVPAVAARLGAHLRLATCYFIDLDDTTARVQVLGGWHRPDVPPLPPEADLAQCLPPATIRALRAGETVAVADAPTPPAGDCASLGGAYVVAPVHREGTWRHLLLATAGTSRPWHPEEIELLQEAAHRLGTRLARARAEEALRESEELFRAVANLVPEFLWRNDAQGYTSWLNERWTTYTGQALAEAVGSGWLDAIHPDDRAQTTATFRAALVAGHPLRQEHRIRDHAGVYRWFMVQALPVLDPQGRIKEWLGSATDIHERKQLEEQLLAFNGQLERQVAERTRALQKSNHLLQAIAKTQTVALSAFQAVRNDGGHIIDLEYLFSNDRPDASPGHAAAPGRRYLTQFPEAERAGFLPSYRRVIETGAMEDLELLYSDAHRTGWYRSIATRLGDGVLVSSEDITARKQAEQERATTLQLLEQVEVVAGLGSWRYDAATGALTWSEGLYRLFELPLGTPVTPRVYLDYVVPDDRPIAECLLQKLVGEPTGFEKTMRIQVGGRLKTLRIKAVVTYYERGQPTQVLGVDLDLSELKRLEAENLHMRLHQQQERISAVLEAQEEERRRVAETLHNGLGQVLYAAKLQLDQLSLTSLLEASPALATARREADRLLSEAILQTRTISHELTPGSVAEFGLAVALRDICRGLSSPQLHWQCLVHLDEEEPPLPQPLQVAVYRLAQELAQNIVKHARARHAALEVETLPGWVVLRSEDDGRGFEPSVSTNGIGLKTLRHRVALLGGTVHLTSGVGQGTQVQVRIPLPPS